MPYVQHFPEVFAVVRTQAVRGPSLQILRSLERHRYYTIQNERNSQRFLHKSLERVPRYQVDRTVYTLRFKTEDFEQVNEVKFWVLPFFLIDGPWDTVIPILEFQYRSWIPSHYDEVPIYGTQYSELLECMERIQEERLDEIRSSEDSHSRSSYHNFHYNYIGNPSFRNLLLSSGPDDYDDRRTMRRGSLVGAIPDRVNTPQAHYRQPEIQVIEVEVPVDRIIREVRVQPLPKAIGDILLANARLGSDTCPILSIPYKECDKLSISSCFHIFDKESLARWQSTHSNCPVCRSKIENIVSE